MNIQPLSPSLFSNIKINQEQLSEMLNAQNQIYSAHPNQLDSFKHGVSKNGTIGGIAKGINDADFLAVAYCAKPDGTTMTTYYYPTRRFYITGNAKSKSIDRFIHKPDDKEFATRTSMEYWGKDAKENIPTSIKKSFYREDGKEVYILKENRPNGEKIRTVKYPSGNIYKKVTNANGDILEYSIIKAKNNED
ncbi:MAG: hypothetical protein IJD57_00550 [Candidatus Gastranaerophilales bacterium]|nr:hypothetical protein [Candidatus Gastranaerophilales bacterium]